MHNKLFVIYLFDKLFSSAGNKYDGKFETFAFVYGHNADNIVIFAYQLRGGQVVSLIFYALHIFYKAEKTAESVRFVAFCTFKQQP